MGHRAGVGWPWEGCGVHMGWAQGIGWPWGGRWVAVGHGAEAGTGRLWGWRRQGCGGASVWPPHPPPAPQLLPKPGELARQPPTHPEETEEELTEQQSPPPGDGVSPGAPLAVAAPDAGDPPERLQDPEGCGVPQEEPGDSGDEAEAPDVTELGVTYKQVRPRGAPSVSGGGGAQISPAP